jgi:hypothetical protein
LAPRIAATDIARKSFKRESPTKEDFNSVGVISRSGGYGELHRRQNHLTTKDTKEHEGTNKFRLQIDDLRFQIKNS